MSAFADMTHASLGERPPRRGHLCGSYGVGSRDPAAVSCPACKGLLWGAKVRTMLEEMEADHRLYPGDDTDVRTALRVCPL